MCDNIYERFSNRRFTKFVEHRNSFDFIAFAKVEVHSIRTVCFCPHENVCTYNYTLNIVCCNCMLNMRIYGYQVFSIEKSQTYLYARKNGQNRKLCIFTLNVLFGHYPRFVVIAEKKEKSAGLRNFRKRQKNDHRNFLE